MTTTPPTLDRLQRPLRNLRISVTDRCNLRCGYCMPEAEYNWLPREDILRFEEILRLVRVFADLGVDKVRLTGGEPLIRKDLAELVGQLATEPRLRDLAMTSNGLLLPEHGAALRQAGLQRLTISLDSLDRPRFARLSGRDRLDAALLGIRHAAELGFDSIKINTVVIRGENDCEIPAMLEFGREVGAEVRFIEYMDVGGATAWRPEMVFGREAILESVAGHFGEVRSIEVTDSAPARRFALADGTTFGLIASTTAPFCASCDRARLTADGMWYLCLYAREGVDLRAPLRAGASHEDLLGIVRGAWNARADRGAEERLAVRARGALADKVELAENPHLEMHTRGG